MPQGELHPSVLILERYLGLVLVHSVHFFPSCSSRFDPTKDVTSQKRAPKKKRNIPCSLTVMAVTDPWCGIPKGKYKTCILDKNRVQKIRVHRSMSATEVNNDIMKAFHHIPVSKYSVLASNRK